MAGFLVRLIVLALVAVIGSYAAFDNPEATYRKLYQDIRCKTGGPCISIAAMTLPGVRVLFVDKALANREGRQVAILSEKWPYCNDTSGEVYEVPQFFETDFASIPSWAQFYIKPSDPSVVGAAIIHDWLYAYGGAPRNDAKRLADNIFRIELEAHGVNVIRRNIMYQAVSLFGGENFGADDEMRFRNPETGALFTQPRPASLVIDQLTPGCSEFLAKYWDPSQRQSRVAYYLAPDFIEQWIDLTP